MGKLLTIAGFFSVILSFAQSTGHVYNGVYKGENLQRLAFPIGGIGAGMFTLEGTGAISHFSIYNSPDMMNEPPMFAAIYIKGMPGKAKVLEGPVPDWKKFGMYNSGLGGPGTTWGLTRFSEVTSFNARFPFADIKLADKELPVVVTIKGWSPFIPTDADNSSLPVGALEYTFTNTSDQTKEFIFSYNAPLFNRFRKVTATDKGFIFQKSDTCFAVFTDAANTSVDRKWFLGSWFDPLTVAWKNIREGVVKEVPAQENATGSSLFTQFTLQSKETKTIKVYFSWYVPTTKLRFMKDPASKKDSTVRDASVDLPSKYYMPWYCSQFKNIDDVISYWKKNYNDLKKKTELFSNAFYKSTLPSEVTEAVAANLTILKSPTVLRQYDGKFWAWEGCEDKQGSCPGSCTHVWNYAQAVSHLFPSLERSLRQTEFNESQDAEGHQMFRSALPIRPLAHNFYAAADGQLGGIMKVYRDWRISGDDNWLKQLYPKVKLSLDYCIATWDPRHTGTLEEPHHNTYDIEFWGAEPMCTSFYLGALESFIKIADYCKEDNSLYKGLLAKGKTAIETKLYNGKWFFQKIQWTGLNAPDPATASKNSLESDYSVDAKELLQKEGPRYQYGNGVLSDGVLGAWMARVCGLEMPFDKEKIGQHLSAIYKYNFKTNLSNHSNPQRPGYALGNEGGLLLCTWPNNDKLSLPFVYSDEVWTGIEYQVASHLIFMGKVKEGLDIVRTARNRYDGRVRNPFDEYECGHWYARAMSSYALIEALTGVRYDAVEKTLYVDSKVGDFTSFLSTDTGFGNVIYKNGKVQVNVVYGTIDVQKIINSTAK